MKLSLWPWLLLALSLLGIALLLRESHASAANPIPLPLIRKITGGCGTVDTTTGGATIPATATGGRASLSIFNAGTTVAYCITTTGTSCSPVASITNYITILEPSSATDRLGGFRSDWLSAGTNWCCATNSSSTKVCFNEDSP